MTARVYSLVLTFCLVLLPAFAQDTTSTWRVLSDARAHHAIWMADASVGWMVGDNGLIRKTADGGATWTIQRVETTATLRGIWGVSANDVWVVGDGGTILYWDGTDWFDHSIEEAKDNLRSIHGFDFDNIAAVGENGTILRWDGEDWNVLNPAAADGKLLNDVWYGSTGFWAVGEAGFAIAYTVGTGVWTNRPVSTTKDLLGVTGFNGMGVFIVGSEGLAVRSSGSTWAATSSTGTTQNLRKIRFAASNRLWAVGDGGVIRVFNGTSWSAQTTGGTTENFHSLHAISTTSAIAVGNRGQIGVFDGTAWTVTAAQAPNVPLNDTWGLSDNHVWMVGGNGTAALYRNGVISYTSTNVFSELHGIHGLPDGTAWAVGEGGTIIKWNGTTWALQPSVVTDTLLGVHAIAEDDVWAVGESGTVVHWDGELWSKLTSGTTANLNGVWALSANSVWFVGDAGNIITWNGNKLARTNSGTTVDLYDVWGSYESSSDYCVLVVGAGGNLLKFGTETGLVTNTGTSAALRGAHGAAGRVWLVGEDQFRTRDGNAWTADGSHPAATALRAVFASGAESVFAVGAGGTAFTNLPTDIPQISITGPTGAAAINNGMPVNFGQQPLNGTTVRTITITNVGNADLTSLAIRLDGEAAADYTLGTFTTTSLAPGNSAVVNVTFSAKEGFDRQAVLEITSNDLDEGLFKINLTGHGLVPITIDRQPEDIAVDPDEPAALTVEVSGSEPITYQWKKGNVVLEDATEATLTIAFAEEADEGNYTCVITNPLGSLTTRATLLTVNNPVALIESPQSIATVAGRSVTLSVIVSGGNPVTYVWKRNNIVIATAKEASLTIPNVSIANAGIYTVTATNSVNSVTSDPATLTVVDITPRVAVVKAGGTAIFTVSASHPITDVTWGRNGSTLPNDYRYTGYTTRTITAKQLLFADSGTVDCAVTIEGSTAVVSAQLSVYAAPPQLTQSGDLPDARVGAYYQYPVPFNTQGDKRPVSFAAVGLPVGLRMDPVTGIISGTPVVALTTDRLYPVTLYATNGFGTSVQKAGLTLRTVSTHLLGSYTSILPRDPDLNGDLGGRIDITGSTQGVVTGKLLLGRLVYSFTAVVPMLTSDSGPPTASAIIVRKAPLTNLRISFRMNGTLHRLEAGTIADDSTSLDFAGWHSVWQSSALTADVLASIANRAGYSTWATTDGSPALDPATTPVGRSHGTLVISKTSAASMVGKLADGATFTAASNVSPTGQIGIFSVLATNPGSVLATLGTSETSGINRTVTVGGPFDWKRFPLAKGRSYLDGFQVNVGLFGAIYAAPKTPALVLNLPETGTDNARLTFGPTSIITQISPSIDLRIRPAGVVTLPAINIRSTKIAINPATGLFTGTFLLEDRDPSRPGFNVFRTGTYCGALTSLITNTTETMGLGYFLLPELPAAGTKETVLTTQIRSGLVELRAR